MRLRRTQVARPPRPRRTRRACGHLTLGFVLEDMRGGAVWCVITLRVRGQSVSVARVRHLSCHRPTPGHTHERQLWDGRCTCVRRDTCACQSRQCGGACVRRDGAQRAAPNLNENVHAWHTNTQKRPCGAKFCARGARGVGSYPQAVFSHMAARSATLIENPTPCHRRSGVRFDGCL